MKNTEADRILHFPANQVVGVIKYLDSAQLWRELCLAKGDVEIPSTQQTVMFSLKGFHSDKYASFSGQNLAFWNEMDAAGLDLITDVNLRGLSDATENELACMSRLTRFDSLSIRGPLVKNLPADVLKRLMDITVDDANDDDLAALAHLCPQLKYLKIERSACSDEGLSALEPLSELRSLILVANRERIDGSGLLSVSPTLTKLSIDCLADDGSEWLSRFKNLESLWCHKSFRDSSMQAISTCAKLKILSLAECMISDLGFRYVAQLTRLESLFCQSSGITGDALMMLRNLKNLRSVDVSDVEIEGSLTNLVELPVLEKLTAEHCQLDQRSVDAIGMMTSLRVAFLARNDFNQCSLSPLSNLSKLRKLSLGEAIKNSDVDDLLKALPDCEITVGGKTRT
ncbi:MAG TPA: hypothetical protein V6C89_17540 [Drouetiella sp.]